MSNESLGSSEQYSHEQIIETLYKVHDIAEMAGTKTVYASQELLYTTRKNLLGALLEQAVEDGDESEAARILDAGQRNEENYSESAPTTDSYYITANMYVRDSGTGELFKLETASGSRNKTLVGEDGTDLYSRIGARRFELDEDELPLPAPIYEQTVSWSTASQETEVAAEVRYPREDGESTPLSTEAPVLPSDKLNAVLEQISDELTKAENPKLISPLNPIEVNLDGVFGLFEGM